ncbi:AMP-binding protein [Paraburkholderia sp. BCC1886]|uniref:AMP-binding protein n=1 Tax=Paraburkholderia sp. BCC1886 TaxID=2562670 RepID=UPI0011837D96|nr:AMP-binding protein [Paraburkholderia sp. BCC1886]
MIALHELLSTPLDAATAHVPVCRDNGAVLERAAFRARVASLAASLRMQDARRYAVCIDDPFDFACALFALFAAGKEPLIPANATPGYLADLADAYDTVLTDAELASIAPPLDATHALDDCFTIAREAPLTLYTSGSSGKPKAIRKTLAQFDAEVHTLERQWGALLGDATVLASVPHHHIYGLLFRVLWPLAAGRAFDRAISIEPLHLQSQIAQCGASVVVSTPAQLSRWPALPGFAELGPAPLAFFSSGGPLPLQTAEAFAQAYGAAPLEIYGSTETGGIAWRRQDRSDAWQPVDGIDVRCDDDGALMVRSPHLDHRDWHRTDDRIAFDEAGRFRLQGRLDRVLKLDGKRVSLPELEARLAAHPFVEQAAVVLLATRTHATADAGLENTARERIGAVVALTEAGSAALRESGRVPLARSLRRHLADYFDVVVLPRHWRFRVSLPFDARGKLPVAALTAAFAPRAEGMEVLAVARCADTLYYELRVPPTLVHFAGHFPGLPILPGVVQVDWAVRLAADHLPAVRNVASVERLKFMAPVTPGALLDLTLTHDALRRRVQFTFRTNGRDCASGAIVYREPA